MIWLSNFLVGDYRVIETNREDFPDNVSDKDESNDEDSGDDIDCEGKPLPGVEVQLQKPDGTLVATTTTTGKQGQQFCGHYNFASI
jgi:hypothetical protein